ncbi:MAG: hypothetical protein V2A34_14210 [Lentisphaerota bacterium]
MRIAPLNVSILGMVLALRAAPAGAVTHYVDVNAASPQTPYTNWSRASTNLQPAIDACAQGDEVLVAPGRYLLTGSKVSIPEGKGIYLKSVESRAAIIDAQRLSPCLDVIGSNSVVEGFTLCNGKNDSYGGGIILSRPGTIRDCLVVSNQAYGAGGIMFFPWTSRVENCTIRNNIATWGGGAIFYDSSTSVLIHCEILDNIASNYAGGVAFQGAGTVISCLISGNRAILEEGGGGVHMSGGVIINSVICGNHADQRGGGIYHGGVGGGRIVNCTIVSNSAGTEAGGVMGNTDVSIWNSIIYFNTAPVNANLTLQGSSAASNCCVTPSPGGSNFTNAPGFLDIVARDFRIAAGSSCVDAGCTNYAPSFDYHGYYRPADGNLDGFPRFDVGAHEYALDFRPGTAVSNSNLTLQWDVINRGGYVVEVCSNIGLKIPEWTRLTGTNYFMGDNPSVTNYTIHMTATGVVYRLKALHTPG